MGSNMTVDVDAFATGIERLVGKIPKNCQQEGGDAVAKVTRKTARELSAGTYGSGGLHEWSERYMSGFKAHVTRGEKTVGEVGNKNKPGLVHLLEKGHLTLTGRKTRAYPHMAPAFDAMSEEFITEYEKAIGRALEE